MFSQLKKPSMGMNASSGNLSFVHVSRRTPVNSPNGDGKWVAAAVPNNWAIGKKNDTMRLGSAVTHRSLSTTPITIQLTFPQAPRHATEKLLEPVWGTRAINDFVGVENLRTTQFELVHGQEPTSCQI
jgi:hypothetical protein